MSWLDEINETEIGENYFSQVGEIETPTDWEIDRLGKFTASRISELMSKGRRKDEDWGQMADKYICEKIAERLTGVPHFVAMNNAMEWGEMHEPIAIEEYQKQTGVSVDYMGKTFIQFSEYSGGSPDGFIGEDGIIEVKCPYNSANHILTVIKEHIDNKYFYQMQSNMLFAGKQWCDFVSYDPRMPEQVKLKVIRVERDDKICDDIADRIVKAVGRMNELIKQKNINL